jgi:hypothetical protein
VKKMRLGVIGAVALGLGVWALVCWWWFVVEIIQALIALALVVGGVLAMTIAARRIYRAKQTGE